MIIINLSFSPNSVSGGNSKNSAIQNGNVHNHQRQQQNGNHNLRGTSADDNDSGFHGFRLQNPHQQIENQIHPNQHLIYGFTPQQYTSTKENHSNHNNEVYSNNNTHSVKLKSVSRSRRSDLDQSVYGHTNGSSPGTCKNHNTSNISVQNPQQHYSLSSSTSHSQDSPQIYGKSYDRTHNLSNTFVDSPSDFIGDRFVDRRQADARSLDEVSIYLYLFCVN